MLQLKNITKDYKVGDGVVPALKGVSINFRKSEFVSILGPSGCGKTTLLNIIGGLDHYTSGDLIINGVSTKQFGDRDWDTYRNHSIGFVFQSYNLIPHQTISENVELALTISGVDKAERVRRAHEALDKVGLSGQYKKKPNQLSGGQCQRVAIARALVNNPQILLADEPTGALDTETSVQIMELISEVASDCLVVMVTHNPELAKRYSTRIINLLDGEVISDSNPYNGEINAENAHEINAENAEENAAAQPLNSAEDENTPQTGEATGEGAVGEPSKLRKPNKKAKLSFWGAFKLSARNLLSKFKRTFLVCLAGSIGIIGVATVLAVSSGVQNFIHSMQNDMLSGNPVTVSTDAFDMNAVLSSATKQEQNAALKKSVQDGYVNVDMFIEYLVGRTDDINSFFIHNDITEEYVKFVNQMPKNYYAAITQNYGLNLSNNLYTTYGFEGDTPKTMSVTAATATYESMLRDTEFADYAQYISMFTTEFRQAPSNAEFILSQYDFLNEGGKIPQSDDEIMLVVSKQTELTDLMLAQYGYYTQAEFFDIVNKAVDEANHDTVIKDKFSHEELKNKTFTWYPNDVVFNKTPALSPQSIANPFTYNPYSSDSWEGGKQLKITAILRPKKDTNYGCLSAGFYYTEALSEQIIYSGLQSQIVAYLNGNDKQAFNGIVKGEVEIDCIPYSYSYTYDGTHSEKRGYVGTVNSMYSMMGAMGVDGGFTAPYTLSKRELGGVTEPSRISVYPTDFSLKSKVCSYLNEWNSGNDITVDGKVITAEERSEVTYTDNLAIVIDMVNEFIDIVTAALVAFTALSLVVSTVMIAIITYVSVIERVKEIGVIRSLGGRKRDVSALFNAETFIIGGIAGVIGIAVTYIISAIINIILGTQFGIYSIAALPIPTALIMIGVSIVLTLISGLIPARLAAKKDPVDALRAE